MFDKEPQRWFKDWVLFIRELREQGLLAWRCLRKILSMCTLTSWEEVKNTESEFSQCCLARGQEAAGTNWNTRVSSWTWERTSSLWQWSTPELVTQWGCVVYILRGTLKPPQQDNRTDKCLPSYLHYPPTDPRFAFISF